MKTALSVWALFIPYTSQVGNTYPENPNCGHKMVLLQTSDSNLEYVEIMVMKLVNIFLLVCTILMTSKFLSISNNHSIIVQYFQNAHAFKMNHVLSTFEGVAVPKLEIYSNCFEQWGNSSKHTVWKPWLRGILWVCVGVLAGKRKVIALTELHAHRSLSLYKRLWCGDCFIGFLNQSCQVLQVFTTSDKC